MPPPISCWLLPLPICTPRLSSNLRRLPKIYKNKAGLFLVSGQVATVPVRLGQRVSAGQTLATIDSAGLTAQVA